MNAVAKPNHSRFEHRYYVAAAVGIIAVVLAGFSVDIPLLSHVSSVSVLVRVHGMIMLTWIALFFVQALLGARHRVDLHMRLGILGAALAIAVVVADTATLITACRLGGHHLPPGATAPLFLAAGLFNLSTFALLVGAALVLRKRRIDWHKRLMLLATLSLLGPAFGRLTAYVNGFRGDNNLAVLLLMLGSPVVCVGIDVWRRRRWHPVFVWGAGLLVAADLLTYAAKVGA